MLCRHDGKEFHPLIKVLRRKMLILIYLEEENKQIISSLIDFITLHCYSFHETVPRQCRFRIPNSISKRVYRIKG